MTLEDEARSRGYSDVFLQPKREDQGLASHLIELKYLKKADGSQGNIDRAIVEACTQLQRYSDAEPFRSAKNLCKTAAVFVGLELAAVEAA